MSARRVRFGERERPHVQRRARERYGVELTRWDYLTLVRAVRRRDPRRARPMCRLRPGVWAWLVRHGATWMVAVFDHHRRGGLITTVLPPGAQLWPDTEDADAVVRAAS